MNFSNKFQAICSFHLNCRVDKNLIIDIISLYCLFNVTRIHSEIPSFNVNIDVLVFFSLSVDYSEIGMPILLMFFFSNY